MHVTLRIRDSGKAGVVFRYSDMFNYYLMEISLEKIDFYVMFNGNKKLIKSHEEKME